MTAERPELDIQRLRETFNLPLLYEETRERYPQGFKGEIERIWLKFGERPRLLVLYRPEDGGRPVLEVYTCRSVPLMLRFASSIGAENLAELEGLAVRVEWRERGSRPHLVPVEVIGSANQGETSDKEE